MWFNTINRQDLLWCGRRHVFPHSDTSRTQHWQGQGSAEYHSPPLHGKQRTYTKLLTQHMQNLMLMIFIDGQTRIHSINFNKMMITKQFISLSKEVCHAHFTAHMDILLHCTKICIRYSCTLVFWPAMMSTWSNLSENISRLTTAWMAPERPGKGSACMPAGKDKV